MVLDKYKVRLVILGFLDHWPHTVVAIYTDSYFFVAISLSSELCNQFSQDFFTSFLDTVWVFLCMITSFLVRSSVIQMISSSPQPNPPNSSSVVSSTSYVINFLLLFTKYKKLSAALSPEELMCILC